MDLKDGKDYWKAQITGELITAPVVDQGSVYATVLDGTVYRFEEVTGKLLWSDKKNATSAPMVYAGQVYLSLREAQKDGDKTVQYEGLARMENAQGRQMDKDLWAKQKADYLIRAQGR
jgi:outer membrane protein assembly factor BamB